MLRGSFLAINVYNKKKISNQKPALLLKEPEKEEQTKPKVNRKKKIVKIGAMINKIEKTNNVKKTKSWFSKEARKIDTPLAKLTNRGEGKA